MKHIEVSSVNTDYSELLRLRDGIYASDLFVAAVSWLDFFTWLSDHPSTIDDICSAMEIHNRPADVMLTLFMARQLVVRRDEHYHLTPFAREHLVRTATRNLSPYFDTMKERPACKDMLHVLRTGQPISWGSKQGEDEWALAIGKSDVAQNFTAAMDSRGAYLAGSMAEAIDYTGYQSLLDVAGGSGIYACSVATLNKLERIAVLEKPPVHKVAEYSIAKRGMSEQISVIPQDMFEGLPFGYDIHLFSNALHDWGKTKVETLISNSYQALPPGGRVVIHDAHLNASKTGPLPIAEYSVLLMSSTEGKCYSIGEIDEMLSNAGFYPKIRPNAPSLSYSYCMLIRLLTSTLCQQLKCFFEVSGYDNCCSAKY